MDDVVSATTYDGVDAGTLAARLELPAVYLYERVPSTLDVAHALAREGAPEGTLVLAGAQTRGRGRAGKSWASDPGGGLWTAFVLRPDDVASVGVLSLRVGARLAAALDDLAGERVRVKWPNDLMLKKGKVAGILAEARWRERVPEWVALGIGINVAAPADVPEAAALPAATSRLDVLAACSRAVRAAAEARGPLAVDEIRAFDGRHDAHHRRASRPRPGLVLGVAADGALLIQDEEGTHPVHAGSLRYAEE